MQLLERNKQLDELNTCLQQARQGCGKLVLIAAEAGLGKSSLVERFVADHRREARALWGACDGLSTPRALAPVHEIAAQIADLGRQLARDDDPRDRLFRLLLEELTRSERASVVVLEDLHWADAATLDFLRFMGRRIQRTSAVFVATYREDELAASHPARLALGELTGQHVIRMRLAPLSPAAVEVLARDSGRDAQQLHRITGGNPFFVREVLASPGAGVPETVRDAVVARLMRCQAAARELAELVALSPRRTEVWLVEAMLGRHPAGVMRVQPAACWRSTQTPSVFATSWRAWRCSTPSHPSVPVPCTRSWRSCCPRAVRTPRGSCTTPRSPDWRPACSSTRRVPPPMPPGSAHIVKRPHISARPCAVVSSCRTARRAHLLEWHAREASLANQTRAAIASADAAIEAWRESGDIAAQARVLSLLSQEYRTVGDREAADRCVTAAISLLQGLPPGADLAMAYSGRSLLAVHRGWDREALEFGHRALELARQLGDRAAESHALCNIGGARLGAGDASRLPGAGAQPGAGPRGQAGGPRGARLSHAAVLCGPVARPCPCAADLSGRR